MQLGRNVDRVQLREPQSFDGWPTVVFVEFTTTKGAHPFAQNAKEWGAQGFLIAAGKVSHPRAATFPSTVSCGAPRLLPRNESSARPDPPKGGT
jgi:hypothetical protein